MTNPAIVAAAQETMRELVAEGERYEAAENWLHSQHVNDPYAWELDDASDEEWDAAYVATAPQAARMSGWTVDRNVTCVVCPECAFTFDAGHVNTDRTGYSCPLCELEAKP